MLEVIPIQSHASTIGNEGHNFVVDSIPSIPEPPQPLPEIPLEAIDAGPVLNTLGEPTFASLGLGGKFYFILVFLLRFTISHSFSRMDPRWDRSKYP